MWKRDQKISRKLGDNANTEAVAAVQYFPALFGKGFTRRDGGGINAALNYGYAILRGHICRSLVIHGLQTELGLFHSNQLNQFNLADDFIEIFRPVMDLFEKIKIHYGFSSVYLRFSKKIFYK